MLTMIGRTSKSASAKVTNASARFHGLETMRYQVGMIFIRRAALGEFGQAQFSAVAAPQKLDPLIVSFIQA